MAELVEVVVGVIGKAHGIRGEVTIDLRTDEPERRFVVGATFAREGDGKPLTVKSVRQHNTRLLVAFEELIDRTAVEEARGTRLVAVVSAVETPTEDEEYYDRQLIGLKVLDAGGVEVGTVGDVVHLPYQDLLEISTAEGDRLVPFVRELVPEVDLEAGLVRLADVAGLLSDEDDN